MYKGYITILILNDPSFSDLPSPPALGGIQSHNYRSSYEVMIDEVILNDVITDLLIEVKIDDT